MRDKIVITAFWAFMMNCSLAFAFTALGHGHGPTTKYPVTMTHMVSGNMNNDFEDFSSREVEAANDLASEFYQQMKVREERASKASSESSSTETWEINNKSSSSSSSSSSSKSDTPKKQTKFTGRYSQGDLDSTGKPSAGLFAQQNGSVYATPEKRPNMPVAVSAYSSSANNRIAERLTPRDQMMRNEFNLVSLASNELTIIVQAALVGVLLFCTLYIGATGGITDGSDRFGAEDGLVNEYNGMGENLDLSNYMNDDSSITNTIENVVREDSSSVWL